MQAAHPQSIVDTPTVQVEAGPGVCAAVPGKRMGQQAITCCACVDLL